MDRQGAIGIIGTMTSFGLVEVQLILASVSAILTGVYMAIQIWKNIKKWISSCGEHIKFIMSTKGQSVDIWIVHHQSTNYGAIMEQL